MLQYTIQYCVPCSDANNKYGQRQTANARQTHRNEYNKRAWRTGGEGVGGDGGLSFNFIDTPYICIHIHSHTTHTMYVIFGLRSGRSALRSLCAVQTQGTPRQSRNARTTALAISFTKSICTTHTHNNHNNNYNGVQLRTGLRATRPQHASALEFIKIIPFL